jgi:hypothetical protein
VQTKEKVERRIRDEPISDTPNLIPAHILAAAAAATTGTADAETQQQAAYDAAFDGADEPYDDSSDSADNDGSDVNWWNALPDSVQYAVQGVFVICAVVVVMVMRKRASAK